MELLYYNAQDSQTLLLVSGLVDACSKFVFSSLEDVEEIELNICKKLVKWYPIIKK